MPALTRAHARARAPLGVLAAVALALLGGAVPGGGAAAGGDAVAGSVTGSVAGPVAGSVSRPLTSARLPLTGPVADRAAGPVMRPVTRVGPGPDIAAWARHGRPHRLLVLRPGSVTMVERGVAVGRLSPGPGTITLGWLSAHTGPRWVEYKPGPHPTMRVRSAVLLAPGAALQIGRADGSVLLSAGANAASGTWIRGSRALLDIDGATLASTPPDGAGPVAGHVAGRPYLTMGEGGRMNIVNSTVTGFGRPRGAPSNESGVTWGKGSTGRAVRSTFVDNRTGVRLAKSRGVRLDRVTVTGSIDDGAVLDADRNSTVRGLSAVKNGRHGVVVSGLDNRELTGITTRANYDMGINATAQRGLTLTRPVSYGDLGGGIRLTSCAGCTLRRPVVHGVHGVHGEPRALDIVGPGSRVTVRAPELTGDADGIGIALEAGVAGATVSGGRVSDFQLGIAVAGSHVVVDGTAVRGGRTAISVHGPARQVTLRAMEVRGARIGITASETTRDVTLTGVRVSDMARSGLMSASPGLRVRGGSVTGCGTAVDLGGRAHLRKLSVSRSGRGVHVARGTRVDAVGLDVIAERKGVVTEAGAGLDLTDSRVRAPMALTGDGSVRRHGSTEISLPPFPWLGFAALIALGLAVLLQTVHQIRHRRTPPPRVAAHVRNTT
ncbi:right-handed parallel beta-helix repeat-containing protein [Streptomyces kunmingensis]|uniref:Right-handed parallel beta-helix repeat-containing protein n=1 Tax=Streptomyces kunmingensis TaxID=68225 RepID=A0ABU6CLR3_9ACTN|nr:right-handed parallel beta-helix repeat-containing protein [Streptomyces kunmingensis]MEB3964891.1 right-handed parallel beta-helix repeat-containing protein [Streptomyces kunmingensis]